MSKQNKQTVNNKKSLIMREALGLFAQKGYEGTSIRDIALAADINLAMVNYYFGSKQQLLEAIFEEMTAAAKLHIDSFILNETLTPAEKLDKVIDGYTHFVIEHYNFFILLMRQQLSQEQNKVDDLIYSLKFKYWRIFYVAIEGGKKAHFFKPDTNIITLSSIVLGTTNYLISDRNFIARVKNLNLTDEEDNEMYFRAIIPEVMEQIKKILRAFLEE